VAVAQADTVAMTQKQAFSLANAALKGNRSDLAILQKAADDGNANTETALGHWVLIIT
jgi:hypothetical protein